MRKQLIAVRVDDVWKIKDKNGYVQQTMKSQNDACRLTSALHRNHFQNAF